MPSRNSPCLASMYWGGTVSSLANKLLCNHSPRHPDIKAANPAYCLVSTVVTQSHVDVFYDSFGSGGLGAIKSLIHYEEASCWIVNRCCWGGGRWNRFAASDWQKTQEQDLIRLFIQHAAQLPSMVTLYFSLPLSSYFSRCAHTWVYVLVCLIWYSKTR